MLRFREKGRGEREREYALNFTALHWCSFNWWSSQLKGQHTLCSKFLPEWNSWQGNTYTKEIVLWKFVQSDTCQISLKWNWKGKTNFLWGQSSPHLVCCTCLIFFYVKEILTRKIWKHSLLHCRYISECLIQPSLTFPDNKWKMNLLLFEAVINTWLDRNYWTFILLTSRMSLKVNNL